MTYQMIRNADIKRPVPERLTSSVLDHATVVDLHEFGSRNPGGLWQSYNVIDTLKPVSPGCPTPSVTPFVFDVAPWMQGFEFSVYAGAKSGSVGLDAADMDAELRRVFEHNEGRGVERALMNTRFAVKTLDAQDPFKVAWAAPVDLTPGGKTLTLPLALAMLEGYAAATYAGLPTIHMPRAAATILVSQGLLVWKNGKAFTANGSKVAIGGGYDVSEADGTWQMWATGEVYVERSEQVDGRMFDTAQFVLPVPASASLSAPVQNASSTDPTGGTMTPGTTFYKITATNGLGETLGSNEVSQIIAAALTTPVNSAFTTTSTGGSLASNATYSYRVAATNAIGQTLASAATTINIPGALAAPVQSAPSTALTGGSLAAGTYFYQVTALNALGETLASNEVSQVTTGVTSTVGLAWGAVAGATGYKVYRALVSGGENVSPTLLATLGAVTSYTDTGTATTAGATPASNTTATATNRNSVNWGAVSGATGYKVYGRTGGSELLIATVGAVTTYSDTGSITPAGAVPSANTTTTTTNDVNLSWSAVVGATGYKVYKGTATNAENSMIGATTGTTFTDTGAAGTAATVPVSNTTIYIRPSGINDNDTVTMVERLYRAGVDGFVATVTATVF